MSVVDIDDSSSGGVQSITRLEMHEFLKLR